MFFFKEFNCSNEYIDKILLGSKRKCSFFESKEAPSFNLALIIFCSLFFPNIFLFGLRKKQIDLAGSYDFVCNAPVLHFLILLSRICPSELWSLVFPISNCVNSIRARNAPLSIEDHLLSQQNRWTQRGQLPKYPWSSQCVLLIFDHSWGW